MVETEDGCLLKKPSEVHRGAGTGMGVRMQTRSPQSACQAVPSLPLGNTRGTGPVMSSSESEGLSGESEPPGSGSVYLGTIVVNF